MKLKSGLPRCGKQRAIEDQSTSRVIDSEPVGSTGSRGTLLQSAISQAQEFSRSHKRCL